MVRDKLELLLCPNRGPATDQVKRPETGVDSIPSPIGLGSVLGGYVDRQTDPMSAPATGEVWHPRPGPMHADEVLGKLPER
jgi:hypothetical protein